MQFWLSRTGVPDLRSVQHPSCDWVRLELVPARVQLLLCTLWEQGVCSAWEPYMVSLSLPGNFFYFKYSYTSMGCGWLFHLLEHRANIAFKIICVLRIFLSGEIPQGTKKWVYSVRCPLGVLAGPGASEAPEGAADKSLKLGDWTPPSTFTTGLSLDGGWGRQLWSTMGGFWTQGLISRNMEKVWVHSGRRAQIHFEQENVKPLCSKCIMKHVRRRINGTQTISTTVTQDDPRNSWPYGRMSYSAIPYTSSRSNQGQKR